MNPVKTKTSPTTLSIAGFTAIALLVSSCSNIINEPGKPEKGLEIHVKESGAPEITLGEMKGIAFEAEVTLDQDFTAKGAPKWGAKFEAFGKPVDKIPALIAIKGDAKKAYEGVEHAGVGPSIKIGILKVGGDDGEAQDAFRVVANKVNGDNSQPEGVPADAVDPDKGYKILTLSRDYKDTIPFYVATGVADDKWFDNEPGKLGVHNIILPGKTVKGLEKLEADPSKAELHMPGDLMAESVDTFGKCANPDDFVLDFSKPVPLTWLADELHSAPPQGKEFSVEFKMKSGAIFTAILNDDGNVSIDPSMLVKKSPKDPKEDKPLLAEGGEEMITVTFYRAYLFNKGGGVVFAKRSASCIAKAVMPKKEAPKA